MVNWRDSLVFSYELDEATGCLRANGEWLTDDEGVTPYGKIYFAEELKRLAIALEGAREEIEYLRTKLPNERIDPPKLELMRQKAARDYAALLEFTEGMEQYLARRISTTDEISG